jgi:hypothetical protein
MAGFDSTGNTVANTVAKSTCSLRAEFLSGYITVHRLIRRGLLKKSKALRKVIIPASEIERFLKETL